MDNYNRFGGSSRGGFGNSRDRGSRDRGFGGGGRGGDRPPITMHRAICDECGNSCEVPFKPSGDKPVYCTSCFSAKEGGNGSNNYNRDDRRGGGGNRFNSRGSEMHSAICDECGKKCEVPFRPSGDKPIYCSDCFESKGSDSGSSRPQKSSKLEEKVDILTSKVDRLLKLLGEKKEAPSKTVRIEKVKEEPVVESKVVAKEVKETKKSSKKVEEKPVKAKAKKKATTSKPKAKKPAKKKE